MLLIDLMTHVRFPARTGQWTFIHPSEATKQDWKELLANRSTNHRAINNIVSPLRDTHDQEMEVVTRVVNKRPVPDSGIVCGISCPEGL